MPYSSFLKNIAMTKPRYTVVMVLIAGLLLTVAISAIFLLDARKDYRERFDYDASMRDELIVKYLDTQLQDIDSLKRFIEGKGAIDRASFRTFVKPILNRKGIQAISWIPIVPANRRAALEAASLYQGMGLFRITERSSDGAKVPAAKREGYYPVYYIEPLQGNEEAVGFDLGSTPNRQETIRAAIKSGRPQATSRIILVQEKEKQFGFLVLAPVYVSGVQSGFISGVYRANDMLQNAIGNDKDKNLDTALTDLSGIPEERSLATWSPTCVKNSVLTLESPFFPLVTTEHPIEFAGRNWSITVTATPQYRHKNASVAFLAVVPIGLLMTLLMALYLNSALSRQDRSLEIGRSHLNTLINTIPDLVWLKDTEGVYLSCNHRFEQFFGATESEIVGKTDYDFINEDLADFFRDNDREAIEAGCPSVNEEWITFASDGHSELVETIKSPLYDSDGILIGVFGVARNITERKQYEEKLQKSEIRFRSIINASPVPQSLNDNQMNITFLNPAFVNTYGYTIDEIPTLEAWWPKAFPDPAYRQQVIEAWSARIHKACTNEAAFEPLEVTIRCKDGTDKTVIADAASLGDNFTGDHLVVLFDINDRIKAENALQKAKAFLDGIIEQSPINMWISDHNGTLIRANQALLKQLGVSKTEIVGTYNIFDDPLVEEQGYMPQVRDVFDKGLTARFTISYDTSRLMNMDLKNTTQSVLDVTISPVLDSEGKVANAIIQHLDISELKQMEKNLREAKAAADAANQAKSQFLANMSHEIRTPLNGILGMSQLMGMTALTQEQQEYVAALQQSGKNLLSLISDILDLSKIEAGKTRVELYEFSLQQCLNDVVMMQKTVAFEKRLTLDVNIATNIPLLLVGDQLRIKQIFLNLLGNAVKFTAEGGVTVMAQLLEQHDSSVLIQITVCDTGIGILPENLDYIFEPFTQEDGSISRKYGGTGLGLTISRRLAELLGGTISVESTPGVGSCFAVTLPFIVSGKTHLSLKIPEQEIISWDGPPLRILLVEDDPINISFGTSLLTKLGHEFITVENGRECLAALGQQGSFDLVLMDIQMPVMSGEEALREIRNKEQGTTSRQLIIAVTAYSMRGDRERFLEEGFDGYVSKPLATKELIAEMKRVLVR